MQEVTIRHATIDDARLLAELDLKVWGPDLAATEDMIEERLRRFPYGVLVAEKMGLACGSAFSLRIKNFDPFAELTWRECSGEGSFKNHNPEGETAYGINITSTSEGVGKRLVKTTLREIVVGGNCMRGVLGSRLAGYAAFAKSELGMSRSAEEYMAMRGADGRPIDPWMQFFSDIEVDDVPFLPVRLMPNYFEDPQSMNYGVLYVWKNPHYEAGKPSQY